MTAIDDDILLMAERFSLLTRAHSMVSGMSVLNTIWPGLGRDLLNGIIGSAVFPRPLRWRVLRALGMSVESANISPSVWLGSFSRVTIGGGTFINYGCMLNTSAPIRIGKDCDVGMRVTFVTSSHEIGSAHRRAGTATAKPIEVGNGVWIGAVSTILPGVTIGEGAIIAAGAVVSRDCEAHSLYAGVPARKVRELPSV